MLTHVFEITLFQLKNSSIVMTWFIVTCDYFQGIVFFTNERHALVTQPVGTVIIFMKNVCLYFIFSF